MGFYSTLTALANNAIAFQTVVYGNTRQTVRQLYRLTMTPRKSIAVSPASSTQPSTGCYNLFVTKAGRGNRTPINSLEGYGFTTKLYPQV